MQGRQDRTLPWRARLGEERAADRDTREALECRHVAAILPARSSPASAVSYTDRNFSKNKLSHPVRGSDDVHSNFMPTPRIRKEFTKYIGIGMPVYSLLPVPMRQAGYRSFDSGGKAPAENQLPLRVISYISCSLDAP